MVALVHMQEVQQSLGELQAAVQSQEAWREQASKGILRGPLLAPLEAALRRLRLARRLQEQQHQQQHQQWDAGAAGEEAPPGAPGQPAS